MESVLFFNAIIIMLHIDVTNKYSHTSWVDRLNNKMTKKKFNKKKKVIDTGKMATNLVCRGLV